MPFAWFEHSTDHEMLKDLEGMTPNLAKWPAKCCDRSLSGLFWSLFALIWWAGALVAAGKNHDCLHFRLTRVGESCVTLNFKTQFEQHVALQFLLPRFFFGSQSQTESIWFQAPAMTCRSDREARCTSFLRWQFPGVNIWNLTCGERLNLDLQNGSYYK